MNTLLKITLFAFSILISYGSAFSQEAAPAAKSKDLSAEIVTVDLAKPAAMIKYRPPDSKTSKYLTVNIVPATKLTRDGELITPADLKSGDKGIVEYTTDAVGVSTALSILLTGEVQGTKTTQNL